MRRIDTSVHAQVPQGAPFIVEALPFQPGKPLSMEMATISEDKIRDWPMVYILSNHDEAYVGQTTSVSTRMKQHGDNEEKQAFTQVNVIFNEEFNASVITDYEHRLIGCLHGDGRYTLTNKNDGMTDTDYFSKSQYAAMFEDLWADLRAHGLAEHTLEEIEESDIFKYSPYKALTLDQHEALEKIMGAIKNGLADARPIVVEGMPGTGKTVLAVFLLKMLKDDPDYANLNVRLLEPITSVRTTLKQSLGTVAGLSPDDVIGPVDLVKPEYGFVPGQHKNIDILLVDEAHKLKRRKNLSNYPNHDNPSRALGMDVESTQLDWVLDQAKLPVLFYDPLQAIGPNCVTPASLADKLGVALEHPITLETQMRVKGGRAYLDYVMKVLTGDDPEPRDFGAYQLVFHEDFDEFSDSFQHTWEQHDLTRMVAGYAWPWSTKAGRKKKPGDRDDGFDFTLGHLDLKWNTTNDGWVAMGLDDPGIAHEVGCIHSIQGYDLSYAYVIIGQDAKLDPGTGALVCDKSHYFDVNGKNTATQEELDAFIRNIYYVLLTRGIYGTHIYVVDQELRAHLRKYFAR